MIEFLSGTITFLGTDIECATQLWENHPTARKTVLGVHDSVLPDAVREHRGVIIKMMGDGVHAAFETALYKQPFWSNK
jgi:class 3 adenylate cyclase